MSGRKASVGEGANKKKKKLVGYRVRVQCSDGAFYEGAVASWVENKAEYRIVLDDGIFASIPPHLVRLPSPCRSASGQKMLMPDPLDIPTWTEIPSHISLWPQATSSFRP